jgi:hypothetical protein
MTNTRQTNVTRKLNFLEIGFFRKKSRSFILLELMIAMSLVMTASVYLFNWPLGLMKKELLVIQKIEMQRIAEKDFALIKEKFYRNEMPLKDFDHPKDLKTPFSSETCEVRLDEDFKFSYKKETFLWSKQDKNSEKNALELVFVRFNYHLLPPGKENILQFTHKFFLKKSSTDLD